VIAIHEQNLAKRDIVGTSAPPGPAYSNHLIITTKRQRTFRYLVAPIVARGVKLNLSGVPSYTSMDRRRRVQFIAPFDRLVPFRE
jgi:hypothetical protein